MIKLTNILKKFIKEDINTSNVRLLISYFLVDPRDNKKTTLQVYQTPAGFEYKAFEGWKESGAPIQGSIKSFYDMAVSLPTVVGSMIKNVKKLDKVITSALSTGSGPNTIRGAEIKNEIILPNKSMKELYVSEENTITIIRGTTLVNDSRANITGAKRKMSDSEIIAYLTDPDNGTDDEIFYDKFGKKYHPWDLESANIIFKGRTYHM